MQRNYKIAQRLLFFERLYKHMEGVEYAPGVTMLFKAFPIKLQAYFLELEADHEKLPDPAIFDTFTNH